MLPEVDRFRKWLRRKSPQATTHRHYTNDLELFFAWAAKTPAAITLCDVDAYVEHCQEHGHAVATVNRRLAALRSFYPFLALEADDAPPNPVIPRRHFIRQGRRLPRDVQDDDLDRLFAVITTPATGPCFFSCCAAGCASARCATCRSMTFATGLTRRRHAAPAVAARQGQLAARGLPLRPAAGRPPRLAGRPAPTGDPALFLNRFGDRLTVTGIQDRLAVYCFQAGVWITCHQLRHTFARHLIEAGMPVTSLQQLLGHVRLRTTQIYLHISDRQVQADYEAAVVQLARRLSQKEVCDEPLDG